MALKDILVVVDDTPASAARLDLAARLTVRCDAHLTALYAFTDIVFPGYIEAEFPQELRESRRQTRNDQTAGMAAAFEDAMRHHGLTDRSEWLVQEGDPTIAAAVRGRYA
ncbi:MAG: universal stress protein, partial [Alphaproteobacteria bacterium]